MMKKRANPEHKTAHNVLYIKYLKSTKGGKVYVGIHSDTNPYGQSELNISDISNEET